MMGEGGYRDIVVDLDGKRLGVALGGVGLAVDGESLGHFTQVGVENRLVALAPGGRNLLVGIGLHRVEVSFQDGVKFAVDMLLLPVVETGVHLLGDSAVTLPYIGDIEGRASGGEVGLAVETDIAVGLVEVTLADGEHLAQVERVAPLAENLILEEGGGGETPACTALVLVFDRCVGQYLDIDEAEAHGVGFQRV